VPLVKTLCSYFTGVVDPHEPRRMSALPIVEAAFVHARGRIVTRRPARGCRDRAQGVIGAGKQPIERCQGAFSHALNYNKRWPQEVMKRSATSSNGSTAEACGSECQDCQVHSASADRDRAKI